MRYTLQDVTRLADAEVLDHLDRQVDVPVLAGLQAQGDVIVIPAAGSPAATDPAPASGVPVVRGEDGGHTHLLIGDGPVRWTANPAGEQTLGRLTVPAGSTAFLLHPEHGATGIAAGTYLIRRQREQTDEIRLVRD